MIKIAFFDIDGTLMAKNEKAISDITKDALSKLKAKGIRIAVATGRLPSMIPDLKGVEFDAYITFDGAFVYTSDAIIKETPILKDDIKTLIDNSAQSKLPIILASKERRYLTGFDPDLWFYEDGCLNIDELKEQENIYQAIVSCTKDHFHTIINNTRNLQITDWGGITADITRLDITKATGVDAVLKYFKIDPQDAIAFGDADNDIPMLEYVGRAVAMCDGSDKLKKIAHDICPSIKDEGIADYLQDHKLI